MATARRERGRGREGGGADDPAALSSLRRRLPRDVRSLPKIRAPREPRAAPRAGLLSRRERADPTPGVDAVRPLLGAPLHRGSASVCNTYGACTRSGGAPSRHPSHFADTCGGPRYEPKFQILRFRQAQGPAGGRRRPATSRARPRYILPLPARPGGAGCGRRRGTAPQGNRLESVTMPCLVAEKT